MTSSESAYQLETAGKCTVVTLAPKLSNEQWGDIHTVGNQLVEKLNDLKVSSLIVDLGAMEYIGSSTVALVVRLWKTVKEREGAVAVISKHPVVLEVLQIAGLDKVWTIVSTREQAMEELGVAQQSRSIWPLCLGLIAAAVAVAGLVILFVPSIAIDQQVVLGMLFGGAGLGTLLGIINTIRESGGRRIVALLALVACVGIGMAGLAMKSGWSMPADNESAGDELQEEAKSDEAAGDKSKSNEAGSGEAGSGEAGSGEAGSGEAGKDEPTKDAAATDDEQAE